ncbi:nitroreductase family protein [Alkaliphilus hydrothermalis]|uniref:Nitroreductase n=1 Tax=Alkaliphilus hydrothermalis TaxID=1482730 RepID=A0ABS2NPY1_9FIRM|nr:nitroreductase family protein [Alkaliphilus hydrothermalis]MBM7614966.1 nitroreductase [Alkaliphilus hydrothermalis]
MRNINQFFDEPITEIIKRRTSVRSYRGEKVLKEEEEKIIDEISKYKAPFNTKVRFKVIHDDYIDKEKDGKIGTYGVIKGSKTYLLGIMGTGEKALEDLGYTFEKALLYGTSLGLASCWLGGTFKKSSFEKLAGLTDEEALPIVSPIGYEADKKTFVDTTMRFLAGSNKRKDWSELFFDKSFKHPLDPIEAGEYKTALEMVRLAPSASNKQPWRMVKNGNVWNLFLHPTKGYGKGLGFNIQRIDIGIAMCHFEMTVVEAGIKGGWRVLKDVKPEVNEGAEYVVSWIEE